MAVAFDPRSWLVADIGSSLQGIESNMFTSFQFWGNIGIGILLLLYGIASYLGAEIRNTAKRWIIGGFVGAIIIVNYQTLKDLFWSAIGG